MMFLMTPSPHFKVATSATAKQISCSSLAVILLVINDHTTRNDVESSRKATPNFVLDVASSNSDGCEQLPIQTKNSARTLFKTIKPSSWKCSAPRRSWEHAGLVFECRKE